MSLEIACFVLYCFSENLARSSALYATNRYVATINSWSSAVQEYCSLVETNEELSEENARLKMELMRMRSITEDSVERDAIYRYSHLEWAYQPAKVIDIATNTQHNFLILNKGLRDGLKEGEGVIAHTGIVGTIGKCSEHFSLVVPIIHPKMNVSCRLKKNDSMGFLHWDGKSSHYAQLTDIARHIPVCKGDTVITSGMTGLFPADIMIGVVEQATLNSGDTYYTIDVKLSTDFPSLKYVQVLGNPLLPELDSLHVVVP